jgi:CRISPR-associated protein Cas1
MVDRRYTNTLYVTSEGSYVHKDGTNVVVDVDGTQKMRVPIHMLGSIACFGRVSLSPALMGFAFEVGLTITHLSANGRFLARVEGPVMGNVLLRRDQFRAHESPEASSTLARAIVIAKATNQRTVVQRALRDHGGNMDKGAATLMATVIERLADIARRALRPSDLDSVRGLEGEAAQVYFSVFSHLLRTRDLAIRFEGRSRRPPRDQSVQYG